MLVFNKKFFIALHIIIPVVKVALTDSFPKEKKKWEQLKKNLISKQCRLYQPVDVFI